jgi:bis(5'-nucleosyl)-tetraphosphatase (symmetrical)
MANYAIGDIQGCHDEFIALLTHLGFNPTVDTLWLAGDLVNRGPKSLAVLREVMMLGDAAIVVLGNHDLHLLALGLDPNARTRRKDTLDEILQAPDRKVIMEWLRYRPLLHYDETLNTVMVHAGLAPQWSVADACQYAAEVEHVLRDSQAIGAFLASMYGNEPRLWSAALVGLDRLRATTNCLTRMRFCEADGSLNFREKGAPQDVVKNVLPWYAFKKRASQDVTIVFGHWSTLRLRPEACARHNVYPLDTGAVWGGALTAMRLEDRKLFSVRSQQPSAAG